MSGKLLVEVDARLERRLVRWLYEAQYTQLVWHKVALAGDEAQAEAVSLHIPFAQVLHMWLHVPESIADAIRARAMATEMHRALLRRHNRKDEDKSDGIGGAGAAAVHRQGEERGRSRRTFSAAAATVLWRAAVGD